MAAAWLGSGGWWDSLWPCYSCCRKIWIPSSGQFSPQCLGVVAHIPFWVALLTVALRYGLGPAWSAYRPIWLRRFAAEQDELSSTVPDQESGAGPAARKPWTAWTLSLLSLTVGAATVGAIGALAWPEHAQLCMTPIIPCIISGLILSVERPRVVPGAVFVINSVLLFVVASILALMPDALSGGWPRIVAWVAGVALPLASIVLMLNMPMRDPLLDSTGIGKPFDEPTATLRSPEDIITLWQWMTVSWMGPLIKIGYKRQLEDEDVWFLPYEFHHSRVHVLFRELSGTVFVRLLKANGVDLLITTFLGVLETSLELADPVLLKQLLGALTAQEPDVRAAIVYAGITLVARLVKTQSGVFSLWYCRRNYERSRGELITMIHDKTLRRKAFTIPSGHDLPAEQPEDQQEDSSSSTPGISTSTTLTDDESSNHDSTDADADSTTSEPTKFQKLRSLVHRGYTSLNPRPTPPPTTTTTTTPPFTPASTGKVLNLLRNDSYEVAQRFWEAPNLTTKPLNFLLSLFLLWRILGPASLFGILILLAGMALNVLLMRLLLAIERVRREVTDAKLQRTSQFVEAIRHLRWYAWQDAWLDTIMESRRAELRKRVQSNVVGKGIAMVNMTTAYLFPVAGFWAYTVVSGKELTVDVAFPALDLFGMLQNSLRELPDLVTIFLNSRVAMGRIEEFMLEPEKEEDLEGDLIGLGVGGEFGPPGELEIVLNDATFSWPGATKKVLRDVSITCGPGLTVVCGKVGIGKTALLQAILGELDQRRGDRIVPAETIGYCAQTPWLESMSIRQNILFSAVYDKVRFEQVIDACCLRDDLNMFRCKDLTLIGENGVGLSGGQRARVALARAVYSQARILLLDDPIAALDHHTATAILKNLFGAKNSPLMAGRLVIFVTHRVDIVTPYAYQIIEVDKGGRVESFDKKDLENNEEELEHLAEIADAAASGGETTAAVEEDEPIPDKFIEDEHRVHGGVLASVYWQYVKAGKLRWWVTMVGFFTLFRIAKIGYFWFLKEWGEQYPDTPEVPPPSGLGYGLEYSPSVAASQSILRRQTVADPGWFDLGGYLPPPSENVQPWLFGFFILSMIQVFTQTMSDAALVVIIYKAGKNLFERAMHRVTNATFRFYDVTPVGRLMNRLTSDMGTIDGQIAGQLMSVAWYSLGWLTSMAVISTTTPTFLVISIAMTALFVFIFDRFLPASQSLRRLETVSLSPLFSNFGTLVEGLTTVRAFRSEPHFQNRIITSCDAFQKMDHMYWCLQTWLQFRFDLLSAISTFTLTLTAILSGLSSGTIGFVLASASNFVQSTHSLCRRYGEMQMQFVSVERVVELLDLAQEPHGTVHPPASWPLYGDDIVFRNVTLRYAPALDPVLKNVSFTIPGGANVAVTGRTGSGKSTLALSLLGTLHPDTDTLSEGGAGRISIGGVDLATVDKHALRRNITFVAQDPVLFPGTLRDNLDPLGERDEAERADVLLRVLGGGAAAAAAAAASGGGGEQGGEEDGEEGGEVGAEAGDGAGTTFTLDSRVDGGGKNLSQGQRQLVGLGRAILRRSPVVILDEATASIDAETAAYIQRLLRDVLKHSTVITIAHKAEAVQDSDFEVVLEQGRVLRAGSRGARLLQQQVE